MVEGQVVTITIGKFWHWAIGSTLTINIATFLRLSWWLSTHYRRYRKDLTELLEEYNEIVDEHNILIEDYNRRNPHYIIASRLRREPTYTRSEYRRKKAHRFRPSPEEQ